MRFWEIFSNKEYFILRSKILDLEGRIEFLEERLPQEPVVWDPDLEEKDTL